MSPPLYELNANLVLQEQPQHLFFPKFSDLDSAHRRIVIAKTSWNQASDEIGQIELQHQGNTPYFRNIWIRELDEVGNPRD